MDLLQILEFGEFVGPEVEEPLVTLAGKGEPADQQPFGLGLESIWYSTYTWICWIEDRSLIG